jgi:hypothetical protein
MGVPPPRFLEKYEEVAKVDLPDWAAGEIEAEGRGTDPQFATPQGRLRAARAAEVDAKRKLGERIAGLHIRSETSVRDFVTEHDTIETLMGAVLVNATVKSTKFEDDTAIVVVTIPGMRIWGIVGEELRRSR